jgi:protease-4
MKVDDKELESSQNWERDLLSRVLKNYLAEQRRARIWSFSKWLVILFLLVFISMMFFGQISRMGSVGSGIEPHTAMISLAGTIQADGDVDAHLVNESIRNAFSSPKSVGVILRINSPGGSPVQSALIYDEIVRLRNENPNKLLVAVVEDMAASGAYYIASAAEKIYVNQSSIVGSIGVLLNGFGFPDLLKKYGIERRLLTAGENKAMLDPFSELNLKHKEATQKMLNEIHGYFIKAVTNERGDRLSSDPIVFSGMIFTGAKSIELGMSDGFGSVNSVARNFFEVENIVDYTVPSSLIEKFSEQLKSSFSKDLLFTLLNSEEKFPIR